jgi:hypothetical protein
LGGSGHGFVIARLDRRRVIARLLHTLSLGLAVACATAACSRTGLDVGLEFGLPLRDAGADDDADGGMAPNAPIPSTPTSTPTIPTSIPTAMPMPPPTAAPDPCVDKPPIPCSGGGYQYCVAGSYSACPQRCGVCIPGSQEVCFISYCHSWGVQTCAGDGLSFGTCQEESPPAACASIADEQHASAALEQCCIDNGYCCQDQFDLDGNGDSSGPLGQCSGVTCSP